MEKADLGQHERRTLYKHHALISSAVDELITNITSCGGYLSPSSRDSGADSETSCPDRNLSIRTPVSTSCQKNIVHLLKDDFLPTLRRAISALCFSLEAPEDPTDSSSSLQAILENISQVEAVLCRVISSTVETTESDSDLSYMQPNWKRRDDTPPGKLCDIAWSELGSKFYRLLKKLNHAFSDFYVPEDEEALSDFSDEFYSDNIDVYYECRTELVCRLRSARNRIDELIDGLSQSESHWCKVHWRSTVKKLDENLNRIIQHNNKLKAIPAVDPLGARLPLTESTLNASILPIKLTRLFFNKICKLTNSELHPVSQLNSAQKMKFLEATTEHNEPDIEGFIWRLTQSFPRYDPQVARDMLNHEIASSLRTLLNTNLDSCTSNQDATNNLRVWCQLFDQTINKSCEHFLIATECDAQKQNEYFSRVYGEPPHS